MVQRPAEDPKFEDISDNRYIKRLEQRIRVLERRAKLNDPLSIDVVDLGMVHTCRLLQDSVQTLTTSSWQTVTMDSITWDTMNGAASLAGETIKVRRAGIYLVNGRVSFAANTTGIRFMAFSIDGAADPTYKFQGWPGGSIVARLEASAVIELETAQTVELMAWHNKGSDLDTVVSAADKSFLTVTLLSGRSP